MAHDSPIEVAYESDMLISQISNALSGYFLFAKRAQCKQLIYTFRLVLVVILLDDSLEHYKKAI